MEKTAVAFLTDYRSGAIGRISLETPLSRDAMMQATLPVETNNEETVEIEETPNLKN
jgi:ribosome biogenesis GTPase A